MNIKPIKTEATPVAPKAKSATPSNKPQLDIPPDSALVERKRQLLEKLGQQGDTRPEKVAQAEAIVANTTYPSNEQMAKLARLITGA